MPPVKVLDDILVERLAVEVPVELQDDLEALCSIRYEYYPLLALFFLDNIS